MTEEKNINDMEFEEAMGELERIVKSLEAGNVPLKESLRLYERGTLLKKRCDSILESAQLRINQIASEKDGSVVIEKSNLEL